MMRYETLKLDQYSMDCVSVEAITDIKRQPGKLGELPWPLELQGRGETKEDDRALFVRFPVGDIFLSLVTTIHELGHLRQHEVNAKLKRGEQTHANLLAEEKDAWERGWERFSRANPESMKELADKFTSYRRKGKLKKFKNLEELYAWVKDNVLKAVEAQRMLFEGGKDNNLSDIAKTDKLALELERSGIREFLRDYAEARVGEKFDESEAREVIAKTLALIITE